MFAEAFSLILPDLRERFVAESITAPIFFGRRHWLQTGNESPSTAADGGGRVVVFGTDDAFGMGKTQDFNGGLKGRQRTITTADCGIEVRIWVPPSAAVAEADRELDCAVKVSRLTKAFIRELWNITKGQWRVASGRWNNDPEETHLYGVEYITQLGVDVPVVTKATTALPQGTKINPTIEVKS